MTAKERYAECKTFEELKKEYDRNIRSAETLEYFGACEKAYKERFAELLREKRSKHE